MAVASGGYRAGVTAAPWLDRFDLLTQGFAAPEWRLLGAIALEHGLSRSVLLAVSGAGPDNKELDAWLARSVANGLLVAVGPTRALALTSAPSREPGYSVAPNLGQLVLRELSRRGQLKDLAAQTQQLLGGRSVSDLSLALQLGDYRSFARRFSVERLPRQTPLRTAAEWLRVSLCEPFDPAWLEATWGDQARPIAERVLREALDHAGACDALYQYLAVVPPDETQAELVGVLCEHALLRGEGARALPLLPFLPRHDALGHAAAAAFASGDVALSRVRLEQAFGGAQVAASRRGPLPRCGAVTPVLALLLCESDAEGARHLAKRLMSVGTSDGARGAGRAFRALLRYLDEPESEHERIDVHDLGAQASVWETLIAAHNVQLHQKQPETRARWAQHLVRAAASYRAAGYRWLAEQAFALARGLSPEYEEQERTRLALPEPRAPELSLWELVMPKPEWQKALQALAAVSETAEAEIEDSLRAVWYVDMADGSLSRPALQEQRGGSSAFSQGRRLSLSELFQYRDRLPPEDQRILAATRELSEGRREFLQDAYEQLIGHLRVSNGARGGARVEVVRGVCRVETKEEAGHVSVVVEPASAKPGINVVPEGEERLVVYRVTEAMQRVMEVLPLGVRVPLQHKPDLLRVLSRLSQSVEVRSPELGVEQQVEADPTPCLRFAPHAGAWLVQAGVRPFGGRGRFFVAGTGRVSVTWVVGSERLRCERDFLGERSAVDALVAACPTLAATPEEEEGRPHHEADNWVLSEASVLGLLSELSSSGVRHELEWPEASRLRLRGGSARASLRGRLRVTKGWYLVTGGMVLDDVTEVTLNELVHAPALAGGRFVRLANGDYVELEERIRKIVSALSASGARVKPKQELTLHAGAIGALRTLAGEEGIELDQDSRAWLERVERATHEQYEPPASLDATLRPYQLEGYRWLRQLSALGLGACLADDMGLGKTVQILALLLACREQGPALVVAPTSVCSNWAREARRFAPELTVLEYAGEARADLLTKLSADGASKLVVCSYGILLQDQAKLTEVSWGTAVLDEAQFIKNAQSLRAQAAFKLSAKQRIAATGTPVENHAADLWSIFNFINPGLLGELADFNRRFVKPIERDGAERPEQELSRVIQPYVLRRLKRDVLTELPPLTELSHEVQLNQDETVRYAYLRKQIHDKLFTSHGKRENKIEVLAEIMRLRRFCCHPRLVFPDAPLECSKLDAFLDLVEELRENGHRALVFSQFVDFLAMVRDMLDERGIAYEYLDGSTPQAARQARVDAFQNGSSPLFLISLKAGGFGLNLTAADYVIHLDPWWNPAVESQATDRAHRIGQERRVTVYRLITKQTIEEKIVELHAKKRNLARSLLDGGTSSAKLSMAELVQLIETSAVSG